MTSRAYNIMGELPAIFATVAGIDVSDVEIGYRDPASIEDDQLPRVLIYNPTTDEPVAPSFGLRSIEYGFAVVIVNNIDTDEATMQLCEEMANALSQATLSAADIAFMNPGSIANSQSSRRSIVIAFLAAQWEGL